MIKHGLTALLVAALTVPNIAFAAQDAGLSHHNGRDAGFQNGLGAQIGMTVKLGDPRAVKGSDKFALRMNAGPVLLRNNGQRSASNLISVNFSPAYRASLQLAGQDVMTYTTKLGAADDEKNEGERAHKKQGIGSKAAWIALVAGGVMVALVGAWVIHCTSNNGNNCSE
ncbi:MAG: hypothetical protein ABL918_12430 [Chakrabartia sp.]